MKSLLFSLTLILTQSAAAATTDVWEGSGALFDVHGNAAGTYRLVVENTTEGNQVQSLVTITRPDNSVKTEQCSITKSAAGKWSSQCNNGVGGGSCFGEGLCISYVEDATGKGYATTIILDGPSDMRLLRTEVQNGKATRFFREKLHKR